MTPEELSVTIAAALARLSAAGVIPLSSADLPASVRVERPRQREHGDWATNVAMQLAKRAGVAPRDLASALAGELATQPGIASADVAGPGFLNIRLAAGAAGELARTIVTQGPAFGHGTDLAGQHINLEYVSANPTGPVHLAHARWAAVGDSLARILAAAGAQVTREYYFNDHGTQIDRFADSLLARAKGQEPPADGYGGQYIADIADSVIAKVGAQVLDLPADEAREIFREEGVSLMFAEIKRELHDFRVDFDVYFHEESLHESGAVEQALATLKEAGTLYFDQGAWWLKSTEFGDDKDRVVIKSDGNAAYIAGDLAYFQDKRSRGADICIYMLGADHHGYIARLKAAAAAFGDDPQRVEVLIGQMVKLVSDGQEVRLSKRAGNLITLQDLVGAVGVDAARYALARSSTDSTLVVDIDQLRKASNDNPVYYVQYAHARTCNVARNAAQVGITRTDDFDPALLTDPSESVLLGSLSTFPSVVAGAAALREPHRVARYLEELAGIYHKWYDACRVIPQGDDPITDTNRARLWLNDATRQVLATGLDLLGVTAPERM